MTATFGPAGDPSRFEKRNVNTLTEAFSSFLSAVRQQVVARVEAVVAELGQAPGLGQLLPGKMLRTRLTAHLAGEPDSPAAETLCEACAAIELVHTASLCHDDVIDNGLLRRGRPAIWQATGASGAVLVGDLILCEAIDLIMAVDNGRYLSIFIGNVREVVAAEAEQEVVLRGRPLDEETCLRLARGKTGPLFAFLGGLCGGGDAELSAVLTEAGYRIGTAYQLADDLMDVCGDEGSAGKTLGTDERRRKFTFPRIAGQGREGTRRHVGRLCGSAVELLAPWPGMQAALGRFMVDDLQPVFARFDSRLDLREVV